MSLSTVGRLTRNSIAMSSAWLIHRGTSFLLYILIARHLGVLIFGQFSLVYTFFLIFQVPAVFGLAEFIVREVAKNKSDFDKYLVNGHFIVLISSLASMGLWILLVHLLGYSSQVIGMSYLLGLALIPFAMCAMCEAIFKAFERMQFVVYAFTLADLIKIGLVWLLLSRGFGLLPVIGLLVIIQVIVLLIEWCFIYRYFPKLSWDINLRFCRQLAKVATIFLGIAVFAVIFMRLNVIILSKFRGEVEVGLYNAVFMLTNFFMFISISYADAIYPVFSRTYRTSLTRFKQYTERSIEFLISLALPMAVGFFFLADSIILFVYGGEFVRATPVMRILGWMLIPRFFIRILGGVLLASGHQRANLTISMVNMVSLIGICVVLIHSFGIIGAGVAVLASYSISFVLHYKLVSKKVFPISILRAVWKPFVSSIFLSAFLIFIMKGHRLVIVVPLAILLYGAVLVGLNIIFGGPLKLVMAYWLGGKSKSEMGGSDTR